MIPFVAVACTLRIVADMVVEDTEAGVAESESALFCVGTVAAEIKIVPLSIAGFQTACDSHVARQ